MSDYELNTHLSSTGGRRDLLTSLVPDLLFAVTSWLTNYDCFRLHDVNRVMHSIDNRELFPSGRDVPYLFMKRLAAYFKKEGVIDREAELLSQRLMVYTHRHHGVFSGFLVAGVLLDSPQGRYHFIDKIFPPELTIGATFEGPLNDPRLSSWNYDYIDFNGTHYEDLLATLMPALMENLFTLTGYYPWVANYSGSHWEDPRWVHNAIMCNHLHGLEEGNYMPSTVFYVRVYDPRQRPGKRIEEFANWPLLPHFARSIFDGEMLHVHEYPDDHNDHWVIDWPTDELARFEITRLAKLEGAQVDLYGTGHQLMSTHELEDNVHFHGRSLPRQTRRKRPFP
jgi:hypothetical protein